MVLRQPPGPSQSHETDEIAARLKRETEARVQASRMVIDAAKLTLKRRALAACAEDLVEARLRCRA